jgi:outer membrane protein OmpA-like peptidoglycan-associated protein
MLTDANGVAVLDTEISGAPSDPQFKLRDIVMRAVGNTLKKIVTSPFRFISNLLNTKEDLGRVQFTPGESQLSDGAKQKLELLKQALAKRPNMRLSVQGTYDQTADLAALKEEQVKSALQKAGITTESLVAHDAVWAKAVNAKYLAQSSESLKSGLTADEQYSALINAENVDPARLSRLAHERAQAVKQYFILQLAVPGESILLNSETRCEKAEQCATSEAIFTLEV